MSVKTEVNINFDTAEITWGIPDDQPPLETSFELQGLTIHLRLEGNCRNLKSRIIGNLRRTLKFFVSGGRIKKTIAYNSQCRIHLVHYVADSMDTWVPLHPWTNPGNDTRYEIWFNLESMSEMLVRDASSYTTLTSDAVEHNMVGYPTGIEFVKSEGGVLFIPHRLGGSSQTHHAVVGQRVRREMWRRTRGGSHFSDYGNLEIRSNEDNPNIHEVWLGESHVWSLNIATPNDIIPNEDYFSSWEIDYVLENMVVRKRMAEFTSHQHIPL